MGSAIIKIHLLNWPRYNLFFMGSGTAERSSRMAKHFTGFSGFFARPIKWCACCPSGSLSIWNNSSSFRSANGVLKFDMINKVMWRHLCLLFCQDRSQNTPKSFFKPLIIQKRIYIFSIHMFSPRFFILLRNAFLLRSNTTYSMLFNHFAEGTNETHRKHTFQ